MLLLRPDNVQFAQVLSLPFLIAAYFKMGRSRERNFKTEDVYVHRERHRRRSDRESVEEPSPHVGALEGWPHNENSEVEHRNCSRTSHGHEWRHHVGRWQHALHLRVSLD